MKVWMKVQIQTMKWEPMKKRNRWLQRAKKRKRM